MTEGTPFDRRVDDALDKILRAAGSGKLSNYMPYTQDRLREAMREVLVGEHADLLAAARKALVVLTALSDDLDTHGTKVNVRVVSDDGSRVLATITMQDVIDAARAAIARAEGSAE